jgi:hypothetical protein
VFSVNTRTFPIVPLSAMRLSRLELILPSARRKISDQVLIQLIEADVDIGFALLDDAKASRLSGQPEFSSRALQEATNIVADIERRLQELGDSESGPFLPLVVELRNEIAAFEGKVP